MRKMVDNFLKMPGALRFLTAMALLYLLFILMSVVPGTVNVHGKAVNTTVWWDNGSGYILIFSSLPLIVSGLMLLMQSRHARPTYIIGWLLVDSAAFWISNINGVPLSTEDARIYGLLCIASIVAFAMYLYLSHAVKNYLNAST